MNCEEFEAIGLQRATGKAGEPDSDALRAAAEHAEACSRCATLHQVWLRAQAELDELRVATKDVQAPARVEMRLLQEFRNRHRTVKPGTAALAAWAFAAAAVLAIAIGSWSWYAAHRNNVNVAAKPSINSSPTKGAANTSDNNPVNDEPTLIADNDGDFTLLPGSLAQETDDGTIVRVRLQRGALGALGLPVNEERAGDWLQVDLLLGQDGQPRAVRLPSETNQ